MIPSRVIGGRYIVLSEIGCGRMGAVWRAEDRLTRREVAVKELQLPAGLAPADRAQFRDQLLRDARTAGRLRHPGIGAVHDVITHDDIDHVVCELLEARTLATAVAEDGPLDERLATEVGRQALAALLAAHGSGLLHRDVVPGNVLLGRDGRVVLTGFGIASALEGLQLPGPLVGSVGYTAPERLAGNPASPAADLWALGATLFHAVEGAGPYERAAAAATAQAVTHADPPRTRCRGPLGRVIAGLLVRSPQDRLSGKQAAALLDAAAGGAVTARGVLAWWRRSRHRPG
ncbi:serine/threonine-protein kinase [Pseudonocardia sp. H11422]|uniref:serine/threonine-protein kinase n=1 Tax=Pseudonocardia sp. H11422 TaxID=2835866 RepID=UPI001BDC2A92|nr:serine/threonine-protein kinase [Pseudonocardia sp. H11422]